MPPSRSAFVPPRLGAILRWGGSRRAASVTLDPGPLAGGSPALRGQLRLARVLGLSGALGFLLGASAYATWQVAVETGQVLAGLVDYPPTNPFYLYHTKLWTLTNQAGLVLLRLGLSEIAVCILYSGLLGMVSFQALSAVTLAFSRDERMALGSPLVVLLTGAASFGVSYPVYLMGASHTYGVLSLSLALLTAALFACEEYKAGSILLGLAPAVHASVGLWLWTIVFVCFLGDRSLWEPLWKSVRYLLVGVGLTAASGAVHLLVIYHPGKVARDVASRYLVSFINLWDGHRSPVELHHPGVYLNVGVMALSLLWLTLFRRDVPGGSRFLLRFFLASGVLGLLAMVLSWRPPDMLPASLLVLMPNRLLNLNVLAGAAFLIGLLAAYPNRGWALAGLVGLLAGLMGAEKSQLWALQGEPKKPLPLEIDPLLVMAACSLALLAAAAAPRREPGSSSDRPGLLPGRWKQAGQFLLLSAAVMALVTSLTSWNAARLDVWDRMKLEFRDWTNDDLLAKVARGKGLLLTAADLHLIQLRTRRPVLLDGGGLDMLPYVPEAGPEMDQILREVYGIDFFDPPHGMKRQGVIPWPASERVWRRRLQGDWSRIRKKFGVTEVLAFPGWKLRLPVVMENDEFVLYRIPVDAS